MKHYLFITSVFFMLFGKSNAQNVLIQNQIQNSIQNGTTDTFASVIFIADTCGATINAFTFTRTLTAPDSGFTNVNLHINGVSVGLVPFALGVTTFLPYTAVVLPGDSLQIDIIGTTTIDTSLIGKTVAFDIGVQLQNCFNDPQSLNSSGPMISISGCILAFGKNPNVLNQTITPGNQILIGSFMVKPFGCNFISSYVVINNIGSTQNNTLHNLIIKKNSATQLGSLLPLLGQNSVVIFTDIISTPVTYDVYADIDTTATDSSKIILDVNLIASSQTPGYALMIDSIGQTMTIHNPTTPGSGTGGPCAMSATEQQTNPWLYRGHNVCLTAFKVQASNCSLNLNSAQLEIFGTAFYGDMTNLEVKQNNNVTVGTQSVMSFNQTIPLSATVAANQSDTFYIWGNLSANALTDNRTYEPKITLSATDSLGNPKTIILTMATKWVKDAPTSVTDLDGKMISFYPNPATDYVTITGYDGMFRITDLTGNEMIKGETVSKPTIEVNTLPVGMYFIQLEKLKPIQFIKR